MALCLYTTIALFVLFCINMHMTKLQVSLSIKGIAGCLSYVNIFSQVASSKGLGDPFAFFLFSLEASPTAEFIPEANVVF